MTKTAELKVNKETVENNKKNRRANGEHLTSVNIFYRYILPEIEDYLNDFIFVDLFCGKGNLILPILNKIPNPKRIQFFEKHIYLFDIQNNLVEKSIENAVNYGIPRNLAEKNIIQKNTLSKVPKILLNKKLPIFHITNPPYLYLGYIVKNDHTQKHLKYFKGENDGYQDLYQIALMNDLRHQLEKMVYIIPSNFLFGSSGTNKIRDDFLKYYDIKKVVIFEKKIFKYTGTNVVICFFEKKENPVKKPINFEGLKINHETNKRKYTLKPEFHYKAGSEFREFVKENKSSEPLQVNYYLEEEDIEKNKGNNKIKLIDANNFNGKEYVKINKSVNKDIYNKIIKNSLFVRTVDTGSKEGRAGLFFIKKEYNVDGILVTKSKYRTHPIQIFLEPSLSKKEIKLLKNYFNILLEYFRDLTDSEFLTTYKYSNGEYTRKYMGLTQARKLIQTFPIDKLRNDSINENKFRKAVKESKPKKIINIIKNSKKENLLL